VRKSTKVWLFVVLALVAVPCVATAVKAVFNDLFEDFKGRGEYESSTLEEARNRGILVTELVAEPSEVKVGGGRIRFGQAWIEERSIPTHHLVWLPAERRIGGYRLHFTDAKITGIGDGAFWFEPNDPSRSLGGFWESAGRHVYSLPIDSPHVDELRLSAVQSPDDPRTNNIRFVPIR
jgi:hypothetical protein